MKATLRSWISLTVLAVGLLSVLLLVATDQIRQRSQIRNLQFLKAVGKIQEAVAISHLWLEEYLTGDQLEQHEIYDPLDQSDALISALLAGTVPLPDSEAFGPLPEAALLDEAHRLRSLLMEFRSISEERYGGFEQGLDMGIGSAMDIRYDAVFRRVLGSAEALEEALEDYMQRDRRETRFVLLLILSIWCAIIALATVGLRTLERRRQAAEQALRESQAQLFQSQKMEAVGRLAGGLAHDINNYLAALRGHCELVSMKNPEQEWIAGKMDSAVRMVEKASSLLERLQTFRRKQPLRLEVLSVNRVVESVLKVMGPSLREDIEKQLDLADDLWNVEIDPTHLEQLLVNLILNAQDAMGRGGTLTLATRNRIHGESGEEEVELRIADTGRGIPSQARDRIFEPFFSTKRAEKHHGLGLAIVYTIVQQSRGRISVDSREEQGTTFVVAFPRSSRPVTVAEAAHEIPEEVLQGDEHILFIDDNEAYRQATRELLVAFGYRVTSCASGEEALEQFPAIADQVDLVLTDVVMTGLSGPETVERLSRLKPVKALFLSAYAESITVHHGVHEERVHFLRKTASGKRLIATVRGLLDSPEDPAAP